MSQQLFPKDFLWGASTASHQVEGGTHTQWDEWEKQAAPRQYKATKLLLGKLSSWPEIEQAAQDPANYISGQGVDHYNRYPEDFQLLQQMHMNAFRFSIEWARIEPAEGQWDTTEIDHYRRYLEHLRSLSITPFVTLWHFTLPVWFAKKGGFTKRSNTKNYLRYVEKITAELGDLLTFVSPLNEPNTYTAISYIVGLWPPQKHNLHTAWRVYRNLIHAHRGAYDILKSHNPDIQVGSALAISHEVLKTKSWAGLVSMRTNVFLWNRWFLNSVKGSQDFIGLNYYMTNNYAWYGGWRNPPEPKNDLGWYMEPKDIGNVLIEVGDRYNLPIYITENGLADHKDKYRKWWLQQTIAGMEKALDYGVDLRGYLHWSLLDNFEWAFGWLAKFGLVAVDRTTMERTLRPSAVWFGEEIARRRGL